MEYVLFVLCNWNVIVGSGLACRPCCTDDISIICLQPQPMLRLTTGLPDTHSFVIALIYKAYLNGICHEKSHSYHG